MKLKSVTILDTHAKPFCENILPKFLHNSEKDWWQIIIFIKRLAVKSKLQTADLLQTHYHASSPNSGPFVQLYPAQSTRFADGTIHAML